MSQRVNDQDPVNARETKPGFARAAQGVIVIALLAVGGHYSLAANGLDSTKIPIYLGIGDKGNRYTLDEGKCSQGLEYARDLMTLFSAGRFEQISQRVEALQAATELDIRCDHYSSSAIRELSRRIANGGAPERANLETLDRWVAENANSWVPLAVRGEVMTLLGYKARGTKRSGDTSKAQFAALHEAHAKARVDLERALLMNPRAIRPYATLFYVNQASSGSIEDSVALLDLVIERGLYSYTIFDAFMSAADPRWGGSLGHIRDAIDKARPFMAQNPMLRILLGQPDQTRADLAYHDGRYEDAIASWTSALEYAENSTWYYYRGRSHGYAGDFEAARRDFDEVIRSDPDHWGAHEYRGRARMKSRHFQDALADFDRAVELRPWEAKSLNDRSWAYYTLKRFEDAVADLRTVAVTAKTPSAWTLRRLGEILFYNLKRPDEAVVAFRRLLELHPDETRGWYRYGMALHELQRHEARAPLEQYLARVDLTDPDEQMYIRAARGVLGQDDERGPGNAQRLPGLVMRSAAD